MSDLNSHIDKSLISGNRIYLCPLSSDDVDGIYQLRSNPIVNSFIDRKPCESKEEAFAFIQMIEEKSASGDVIYRSIKMKETKDMTGTICVFNFLNDDESCEVGYELLPEHQGKGIMNEALKLILDFCKNELSKKIVFAEVKNNNIKSISLLEKLGFAQEEEADEDGYLKFVKKI